MKDYPKIPLDLTLIEKFTVQKEMSATHLGSGTVAVLSTPSMILFMEMTARKSLEPYLTEGQSSVGTEVNIRHKKAVKIGEEVTTEIKLLNQDRKKLKFSVSVTHNGDIVGDGTHTRYIIFEDRFLENLE